MAHEPAVSGRKLIKVICGGRSAELAPPSRPAGMMLP
jgi:hypothetical protein